MTAIVFSSNMVTMVSDGGLVELVVLVVLSDVGLVELLATVAFAVASSPSPPRSPFLPPLGSGLRVERGVYGDWNSVPEPLVVGSSCENESLSD